MVSAGGWQAVPLPVSVPEQHTLILQRVAETKKQEIGHPETL